MCYCNEFIFRCLLPHIACQVASNETLGLSKMLSLNRIAVIFIEEENVSICYNESFFM